MHLQERPMGATASVDKAIAPMECSYNGAARYGSRQIRRHVASKIAPKSRDASSLRSGAIACQPLPTWRATA